MVLSNVIADFFEHASGKKIFQASRASRAEASCAASLKPSKAQAPSSALSGSLSAAALLHV